MEELVLTGEFFEVSVLVTAARHEDIEFFKAVVTCLRQYVTSEQVRVNQPFR